MFVAVVVVVVAWTTAGASLGFKWLGFSGWSFGGIYDR
jgi:hypothetical protein